MQISNRIKKLEQKYQPPPSSGIDLSGLTNQAMKELLCHHPHLEIIGMTPYLNRPTTDQDRAEWAASYNNVRDWGYVQCRPITMNVPRGENFAAYAHCYSCGHQAFLFDQSNLTQEQLGKHHELEHVDHENKPFSHEADFYAYELIQAGFLDYVRYTPAVKEFYETNGGESLRGPVRDCCRVN